MLLLSTVSYLTDINTITRVGFSLEDVEYHLLKAFHPQEIDSRGEGVAVSVSRFEVCFVLQ